MRYFIFLLFLTFFCSQSYAQTDGTVPICAVTVFDGCIHQNSIAIQAASCDASIGQHIIGSDSDCSSWGSTFTPMACKSSCVCPEGKKLNRVQQPNGVFLTSCILDAPSSGGECEFGEVYDPVTQTTSCNTGEGNESSSSSSQSCVVPGDFNGDCVPDDEQSNSSPPSSSPPVTSSPSSSGGGDGDDGGDEGGGGGGGGGNPPTNNTGGGSASSSGSNSSWTPNSGYGGWLPVAENSPCPNKYQDNQGQWWCAAAGQVSSKGAGQCDPTARDYLACISANQPSSSGSGSGSSVCSPSSPDYLECSGKLQDSQTTIAGAGESFVDAIDEKTEAYKTALTEDLDGFSRDGVPFANEPNYLKTLLVSFLPVSTACNPPSLNLFGKNYELDCKYFNIFKAAFGWMLAILTAFNIYQLAIRPVNR